MLPLACQSLTSLCLWFQGASGGGRGMSQAAKKTIGHRGIDPQGETTYKKVRGSLNPPEAGRVLVSCWPVALGNPLMALSRGRVSPLLAEMMGVHPPPQKNFSG